MRISPVGFVGGGEVHGRAEVTDPARAQRMGFPCSHISGVHGTETSPSFLERETLSLLELSGFLATFGDMPLWNI